MDLDKIKAHLFDREYMSGVARDQLRVKSTGEVFTPTVVVKKMLDDVPDSFFSDPTKTAVDPACGDGQWLADVLWRKLINGVDFEQALSTIYGVDLMQDNVDLCRQRLLCGRNDLRHIVETNIICHNALTYDYSFNGTNENHSDAQWDKLFESS
jgi:type I restriction-modification system DNA methylase subunit